MQAIMSGSGPTVFGIFKTKEEAGAAFGDIRERKLSEEVYISRFI